MKDFRAFMIEQGYSKKSITSFEYSIQMFLRWLEEELIEVQGLTSQDLLDYCLHLRKQQLSTGTMTSYLSAIKHYLKYIGRDKSEFANVKIINRRKGINLSSDLSFEDLQEVYAAFPSNNDYHKRDKVVFGLVLFQALDIGAISKLQVSDLKLDEGVVDVSSSKNTNDREVKLETLQMLPLIEYLTKVRSSFVEGDSTFLFPNPSGKTLRVHRGLVKKLRRMNPKVESLKQVRAIRINYWLRHHNLREVQYWCGHKYVSSTESYLDSELMELEGELGSYHPLS